MVLVGPFRSFPQQAYRPKSPAAYLPSHVPSNVSPVVYLLSRVFCRMSIVLTAVPQGDQDQESLTVGSGNVLVLLLGCVWGSLWSLKPHKAF